MAALKTYHSRVANARLKSQQIVQSPFDRVVELISYMGAIQAQDFAMSKWAIGLRVPGSTQQQIEDSLDKGEMLRVHVLRPTWHIIPAADVYWMQSLSAAKIKSLMRNRDKQLELSEKFFSKSNAVIERSLRNGEHVTRVRLAAKLLDAKIKTDENRLSHLLLRAELEGIACSGKTINNKRTYALLDNRVPHKKTLSREEALALLAGKYFRSRGPATLHDFTWWSGLSVAEAKKGLEMVSKGLMYEKMGNIEYWFNDGLSTEPGKTGCFLLPAFDEFIISYKDRTASLHQDHHKNVLTANGIFYPAIVVNGQVVGTWKKLLHKGQTTIQPHFFLPVAASVQQQVKKRQRNFLHLLTPANKDNNLFCTC